MDIPDTILIMIFGLIPFIGVYIVATISRISRNMEESPETIEEYDESD